MSSSHIPKACVGLEATLSDSNKKYIEKVNALLAAWEHVTNYIATAQPETVQSLIEWANEHTLSLVLRGEWPKLAPVTELHLKVTLQRCEKRLAAKQHPAVKRCQELVELVKNPWGKPALENIISGQANSEHEEEEFCCQEKGELLKMRLKILCEDRCEDIAVNLAAACVRSLHRQDGRLRASSEPSHVQYMMDVYIVLLYKLKRTQDIVAQLKVMELKDSLELMQRLSGEKPTKYGTAKVWRNSNKAAELVAQYLVTTGMIRPLVEVSPELLEQILNSWALLHAKSKDAAATLPGIIRKLIEPAESAQHIFIFCEVLIRHFGDPMKSLVVELYIRALTTDMNELESHRSKSNKEKVQETAQRLSQEFLKLADYVSDSIGITRECVLTAFSLHPTRTCYDRIRELAVACGKLKREDIVTDASSGGSLAVKTAEGIESDVTIKQEPTEGDNEQGSQKETESTSTTASSTSLVGVTSIDDNPTIQQPSTSSEIARIEGGPIKKAPESLKDDSKCHSQEDSAQAISSDKIVKVKTVTQVKKDFDPTTSVMHNQDALILIKGDAVTGSANYDEKAVPSQVLDGEKLGLNPQLCDDLAVVLSSQRYHVLTWWLEWKELSELCERYLENAEEMRNTNKELKYLNIDYSQFKDQPYLDVHNDNSYGIEKGYEQWDDSDYSESDNYQKAIRRSLGDSSDSSSSENIMPPVKRGRPRKVARLDSSESEYDIRHRKPKSNKRVLMISSSDSSDNNTQDSQTSSLGSDGCKKVSKKLLKKGCNGSAVAAVVKKKVIKRRTKKSKLGVDSASHFHMLVNENIRPISGVESIGDNSNNDIMTLFSADLDENKCETIRGSSYKAAQLIISEKRSDPEVIKSLRMFRPNSKKLTQINEKANNNSINSVVKAVENNNSVDETKIINGTPIKFAPMLSTLNLNPKIALRRVDEIDKIEKKISAATRKQVVSASDLNTELRIIQKESPFASNNKSAFAKLVKTVSGHTHNKSSTSKSEIAKSKLHDILSKSIPGYNSMEFSKIPPPQTVVHVVQVSRNIPQSPNSTVSGNTPPRGRSNIQMPGTPSSGGHDSGVGMSPAGQTPPPTTRPPSSLQDVGEEANQPPDTSPSDSTNTSTTDSTNNSPRTVALTVVSNQRTGLNPSPKKTTTGNNITEQQIVLRKADGSYHLVSPNIVTGQRGNVLSLNDASISFARQIPVASIAGSDVKTTQPQATRNTSLPKFQQAFGKQICTLTTESTTVPSSSASDTHAPAAPSGAATNVTLRANAKATTAANITKSVQATLQNASVTNIPNLQVAGTTRLVNLVQNANVTTASGQKLQIVQNSTPGVIYTHKIPVTLAGANSTQLLASLSNSRQPVQLIAVRTPFRNAQGAILRLQPQQQQHQHQQQQQQQTVRPATADSLINSPMESQVSSSTLEQLREFESVLEQVKERSTSSSQSSSTDTTTVQTQTQTNTGAAKQVNALTQQLLMSTQTPAGTIEFPSNGNTITFQQQEVYPQKVALMYTNPSNAATSAVVQSATAKLVAAAAAANPGSTPVVVVTSYCQPAASPALSVTSQSSSSPCVTPAPSNNIATTSSSNNAIAATAATITTQTGNVIICQQSGLKAQAAAAAVNAAAVAAAAAANSSKNVKKATPKTVKVTTQSIANKTTPIPKPQQKPQEDPETTQRIYAILGQYAEQLRNSPDLNNKPAPRRRSNPPTNPNQSSKRKKSGSSGGGSSNGGKSKNSSGQTPEPSPSAEDMNRTMGSEDSSNGAGGSISGSATSMMHIQDSPAGFSGSEDTLAGGNSCPGPANDNATHGSVMDMKSATSDSNDSVDSNVKRRNLIFTEPNTGQSRAVIVQEGGNVQQATSVGEAIASVTSKMTTGTAVLVSGTNFMLPMNFVKSGQQITVVSGGSKLLAAVPAGRSTGGTTNALVLQSLLNQANKVIQQQNQLGHQNKQIKIPMQGQVVIPQGGVVRFASELDNNIDKSDTKAADVKSSPATQTIGLLQHSGVITSNPNIGQRIFNSSSVKIPIKSEQQQQVVCLATPTGTAKLQDCDQKVATTIALAFTAGNNRVVSNNAVIKVLKEEKDVAANVKDEKMLIPNIVVKKEEQSVGVVAHCNDVTEPSKSPIMKVKKESTSPVPVLASTTSTSNLDGTPQFLVSGALNSSDSQESASSTIQSSTIESSMDGVKVENGVLCGNARLQEAWEPERKGSPDTPWRYVPTTNSLNIEQLKVFTRDNDNSSDTVNNSMLQIISKGQGIEMSSSGVFQTKKYYNAMNNSIDNFQKFPVKVGVKVGNNARTIAEQENQQRKQQAIEHQLKLQKSLSEECEDLGVDEPSTSDLFPEADLLFDTNHSPSFDHSSQEATCSGTNALTGGIKSFSNTSSNTSFFGSSISPVVAVLPAETKKKPPPPKRTVKPKETQAKKNKRSSDGLSNSENSVTMTKQLRLSLVDNLSQDEASNSTSDLSRLSPTTENDSCKETGNQKDASRNGSKDRESTPSSSRSSLSQAKLDLDADSQSAAITPATLQITRRDLNVNNVSSTASEDDEPPLALFEDNGPTVTVTSSPLSPVTGPLTISHRYTYANKKKTTSTTPAAKQSKTSDYYSIDARSSTLSWGSPMSERTRSSSDEEDDELVNEGDESSNVSEALSTSQVDLAEGSGIGNGVQDSMRILPSVKVTPIDHATYPAKRKAPLVRRAIVNHRDSNIGISVTVLNRSTGAKTNIAMSNSNAKKSKLQHTTTVTASTATTLTTSVTSATSENDSSSPIPVADQSDDELSSVTIISGGALDSSNEHCSTARRSSSRGHVKKNCACCNGTPERPKVKKILASKSTTTVDHNNSKVKKTVKQPQQQLTKPLAKKR